MAQEESTQQGRVINWLRVLQISKEILAIDEFNVNACVSKTASPGQYDALLRTLEAC